MKRELQQAVLCASVVSFCSSVACGYAPVRAQSVERVRVAAVKNATAQADAGGIFASALRSELAGRGRLDDDSASSPELILELISLRSFPAGTAGEGATSFHLDADLKLNLGAWEDRLHGGEDYLAGVDVLGTEANRRAALRRLARSFAREAIDRYEVSSRLK